MTSPQDLNPEPSPCARAQTGNGSEPAGLEPRGRFLDGVAAALLRAAAGRVARMPLDRALALGARLGDWFGNVLRYHRRDARDALRRAFPDKPAAEVERLLAAMYEHLGMNVIESLRLAGGREDQLDLVTVHGEEHLKAALARRRGALILTAHLGNWDLLSLIPPRRGYPLTVITKDVKHPALNAFWMSMRRSHGLRLVPVRGSYRTCLAALRRNELVGFVLDQNMIAAEGIFVDFFSRPACTTPGLAYMAAQAQAPVVPAFIVRGAGGHHDVYALPALDPPPDRHEDTIRAATQTYTRIIEDWVRRYPEQWIWIHRRWRTRPRAGSSAEPSGPC